MGVSRIVSTRSNKETNIKPGSAFNAARNTTHLPSQRRNSTQAVALFKSSDAYSIGAGEKNISNGSQSCWLVAYDDLRQRHYFYQSVNRDNSIDLSMRELVRQCSTWIEPPLNERMHRACVYHLEREEPCKFNIKTTSNVSARRASAIDSTAYGKCKREQQENPSRSRRHSVPALQVGVFDTARLMPTKSQRRHTLSLLRRVNSIAAHERNRRTSVVSDSNFTNCAIRIQNEVEEVPCEVEQLQSKYMSQRDSQVVDSSHDNKYDLMKKVDQVYGGGVLNAKGESEKEREEEEEGDDYDDAYYGAMQHHHLRELDQDPNEDDVVNDLKEDQNLFNLPLSISLGLGSPRRNSSSLEYSSTGPDSLFNLTLFSNETEYNEAKNTKSDLPPNSTHAERVTLHAFVSGHPVGALQRFDEEVQNDAEVSEEEEEISKDEEGDRIEVKGRVRLVQKRLAGRRGRGTADTFFAKLQRTLSRSRSSPDVLTRVRNRTENATKEIGGNMRLRATHQHHSMRSIDTDTHWTQQGRQISVHTLKDESEISAQPAHFQCDDLRVNVPIENGQKNSSLSHQRWSFDATLVDRGGESSEVERIRPHSVDQSTLGTATSPRWVDDNCVRLAMQQRRRLLRVESF